MVIPVCFKCQSPVEIMAEPKHGVEVISFQCTKCGHIAANFLLGYGEPDDFEMGFEVNETVEAEEGSIQRAKYFRESTDQYKLRAKMQGLKELRANTDGARQLGSSENSDDAE